MSPLQDNDWSHEKYFTLRLHSLVILQPRDIDWKRRNRWQMHPASNVSNVIFGRADIDWHQITNLQMHSNIYLTSAVTLARVCLDGIEVICGSTPAAFLTRWDVWLKRRRCKSGRPSERCEARVTSNSDRNLVKAEQILHEVEGILKTCRPE